MESFYPGWITLRMSLVVTGIVFFLLHAVGNNISNNLPIYISLLNSDTLLMLYKVIKIYLFA